MGKLVGLFAFATLGAGALWWASSGNVAMTATESGVPSASGPTGRQLTSREHLELGRQLYRQGQLAAAKNAFEEAVLAPGRLTPAEQQELGRYLGDPKLNNLKADYATATYRRPYDSTTPYGRGATASPAALRRPVDDLMRQAYTLYQRQEISEAVRMADAADRMAKQLGVRFRANEMTPAQFSQKLRTEGADFKLATVIRGQSPDGSGMPEWARPTAAPQSDISGNANEQAQQMLKQAQELVARGQYEQARKLALEAEQLPVSYGLFDLRPEHILSQVERLSRTSTYQAVSNTTPVGAPAAQSPEVTAQKEQAQQLIAAAKQAQAQGRFAQAKELLSQAMALPVTYSIFEERPDVLLSDIERLEAAQNVAAAPQPTTAPVANPGEMQQVQQTLANAREALRNNRFDEARQLAQSVQGKQLTYNVFDDRPEMVLADVDRLSRGVPANAAQPLPTGNGSAEAFGLLAKARQELNAGNFDAARQLAKQAEGLNASYGVLDDRPDLVMADVVAQQAVAASEPTTPVIASSAQQDVAQGLLKQAREAVALGDYASAQRKVSQAEAMKVAYGVLDDRPDLVRQQIAELQRLEGTTPGAGSPWGDPIASAEPARTPVTPVSSNEEANPFASATGSDNGSLIPTTPVASALPPVVPAGASAQALYDQGLNLLRAGDSDGAYNAFLAAYESGEQLPVYQSQRLRDYLRELHPRRGGLAAGGIQTVSGQQENLLNEPNGSPSPIDIVQREDAVAFNQLRSEVLNAVIRADRLKDENPEQALEVIERAMATVENADLDERAVTPLLTQLQRTRSSVDSVMEMKRPLIDLKRRNEEVEAQIKQELVTKLRVEQEMANLVEQYNRLFQERRYAEAEQIAKEARELNPENPVVVTMVLKAKFARQNAFNENLKERKEEGFLAALNEVEEAAIPFAGDPMQFPTNWKELTERRLARYGTDARQFTDVEKKIKKALDATISLHFDNVTFSEIVRHIGQVADINIVIDDLGMTDSAVSTDQPVSINVDGVKLKSALNLILEPLRLTYTIKNEALQITSPLREQGELVVATYPVSDLVVPIQNFDAPKSVFDNSQGAIDTGAGQMSVSPFGGMQNLPGQVMAQVGPQFGGNVNPLANPDFNAFGGQGQTQIGGGSSVDYDTLMDLIVNTVEPESWIEMGGAGSVRPYNTTLSLVIRQTQKVHEEIAELLQQLRRLQDLQVTVEVRFVTVTDRFFEQIGVDFDFDVQDSLGDPVATLPPFGSLQNSTSGIGGQAGQQGGQAGQQAGGGVPLTGFVPLSVLDLTDRDSYASPTAVGLGTPTGDGPPSLTNDGDIQFRQGSFDIGIPPFADPNILNGGMNVGLAILSDIEAFFFIRAVQTDDRSNLMFAPKVTLFNGQSATVQDNVLRPFVTSLVPIVGAFSVGFQPVVQPIPEGITLTVQAVISADRRYVRLTIVPLFTNITDVFTFSFQSGLGAGAGVQGLGQGGQQAAGGAAQQGFGGAGGAGGGALGVGGIGQGVGGQGLAGNVGLGQGGQGQGGAAQLGGVAPTLTIQQPVVEVVSVSTTVSVPDGGTVLLGGIKRLREGRNMAGVPILNKLPYISRLFKNSGVGRETESLMLMVTPRIIIQEEEEELLLGNATN